MSIVTVSEASPTQNFESTELTGAMTALSTLNPVEGKAAMMTQVDEAAQRVLRVLAEGDPDELQKGATYLNQIKFVLGVMEQCKDFRDAKFTRLVRTRAEEIMTGLENLPKRSKELKEQKLREAEEAKKNAAGASGAAGDAAEVEEEAAPKKPEFTYELAEKICIQSVVRHYDGKLDCLRSVNKYGRHSTKDIGIAPHFLYSLEFSVLIEDAISALIKQSRDLLTRRVYNATDPEADEEAIRAVLRDKQRPLMDVVTSGFSGWGMQQVEEEKRRQAEANANKDGPQKKDTKKAKKGGLFSKLLGKEKKEVPAPKKAKPKEAPPYEEVMEIWKKSEDAGEIFFPKTFNFGILSYLADMRENLFSGEVERVTQIAEQAKGGSNAKGAVARGLEQAFQNSDQNFFEMLVLNLLYTKSGISLEDVQGALMGQKLDTGRLPLSVPELGRRPVAYSKHIIKLLKKKADPRDLQIALDCFFEAMLILHLKKFEDDFKNATTHLEQEKPNLPKPLQGVVDGVLGLIDRVLFAREQARETGENTTNNTRDTINHSISKFMTAYSSMHEKMTKG